MASLFSTQFYDYRFMQGNWGKYPVKFKLRCLSQFCEHVTSLYVVRMYLLLFIQLQQAVSHLISMFGSAHPLATCSQNTVQEICRFRHPHYLCKTNTS